MAAVYCWRFFPGGGIFNRKFVLKVKAAEIPAVTNLGITASADGISAQCEFSGYRTGTDYTIQLYLHEMSENGARNEISCKDVEPESSGTGIAVTEGVQVNSGVYMATTVTKMRNGGEPAFYAYKDSLMYDVVKGEGGYVITEHQNADDGSNNNPGSGGKRRSDQSDYGRGVSGCRHEELVFEITQPATVEEDALQEGRCSACGETLSYAVIPNSAYAAFLQETVQKIQRAVKPEVVITTRRWVSFNRAVFEAMAERPDVAVTVNYQYDGTLYEVTIPAGSDVSNLVDENGFCGFRCLDQVFEGKELTEPNKK